MTSDHPILKRYNVIWAKLFLGLHNDSNLGLGSNLGDSRQILSEAILNLLVKWRSPNCIKAHPWRSTELSKCSRSAKNRVTYLLDQLQRFEQEAGRVRLGVSEL